MPIGRAYITDDSRGLRIDRLVLVHVKTYYPEANLAVNSLFNLFTQAINKLI
jgi:hypothetical protein